MQIIEKLPTLWSGTWENRLAMGTMLMAGLLCVTTLVWQTYSSLSVAHVFGQKTDSSITSQASARGNDSQQLEQYPIFGRNKAPVKERVNTKYTLLGILLSSQPEKSKAIIAQPGKEEKLYRVGDSINGGKIERIDPDKVILRTADALESLHMTWDTEGVAGINKRGLATKTNASKAQSTPKLSSERAQKFKKMREQYLKRIQGSRDFGRPGGKFNNNRGNVPFGRGN